MSADNRVARSLTAYEISSRRIRFVQKIWSDKHPAPGRLPSRAEIQPWDLVSVLPHVMLIDVRRPDHVSGQLSFTYRVVGTMVVKARHSEFTGKNHDELPQTDERIFQRACLEQVVLTKQPHYATAIWLNKYGDAYPGEICWLPLSRDGAVVDQILALEDYNHEAANHLARQFPAACPAFDALAPGAAGRSRVISSRVA